MSIHEVRDDPANPRKVTAYVVRWREGARNRKKTFRKSKFPDAKARAELWDADVKLKRAEGRVVITSRLTVEQLADRWEAQHVDVFCRPRTRAYYKKFIKLYIKPELGHYRVGDVNRSRVSEYVAALSKRGVSASNINKSLDVLRAMFEKAVLWEIVAYNPVAKTQRPKHRKAQKRLLSLDEVAAIARAMKLHRDYAMVVVAAFTGLRISELVALRKSDVAGGRLVVTRSRESTGEIVDLVKGTVGGLPLFAPVAHVVQEWLAAPDWDRLPETELLFPNELGGVIDPDNWRKRSWYPACKTAEVEATPHDLRHFFISMSIHAGGANVIQAQAMARHASSQTTLNEYSHELEGDDKQLRRRMDRFAKPLLAKAPAPVAEVVDLDSERKRRAG